MFAANGGATSADSKTYVEDVFSTYLYSGNSATQKIDNGIALIGQSTIDHTKEPYYQNTVLHLTGDGTNGAQNNTFLDSSTNNFTITRNGNTTQGTFSPYGNLWSNYFDGTGDYLTIADSLSLQLGTGNFTIEGWVYLGATGTARGIIGKGTSSTGWLLSTNSSNNIVFTYGTVFTTIGTLTGSTWYHIAVCREGTGANQTSIYINGTKMVSFDVSDNFNQTSIMYIGADRVGASNFNGYISNLRIVKGTALYTSNFTPSTTPLTAVSGTSLLTCQSNRFIDNSSNNFTLTVNGNTSVQRFSPFNPTSSYSAATIGGSGYFDGTGDYLSTSNSPANFTNSNFTIECFAWFTTNSAGYQPILMNTGTGDYQGWVLYIESNNLITWGCSYDGGSWSNAGVQSSFAPPINCWTHIAIVRNNGVMSMYINGVQASASSNIGNNTIHSPSGAFYPGYYPYFPGGAKSFNGYLSDIRLVNGTALYTSNFTAPTAPLTAIANTSLLCNFTNAGISDATSLNNLETVGNAQVSTSVKKYGTGSLSFNGTDAYCVLPYKQSNKLATGDWTIEFWMYCTGAQSSQTCPIYVQDNSGGYSGIVISANASREVSFTLSYTGSTWDVLWNKIGTYTDNTWNHVAVVRSGSAIYGFFNGVLTATSFSIPTTLYSTSDGTALGKYSTWYFNGYIDDIRITKGVARYTHSFTVPTSAYPTSYISGSYTTATSGYDGLVWTKCRSANDDSRLFDTKSNALLASNLTNSKINGPYDISPTYAIFPDSGFIIPNADGGFNTSNKTYTSWTFRKAPKFFDVVTYTGDGTSNRQIAHALAQVPGMIIVKCTSSTGDWYTLHRVGLNGDWGVSTLNTTNTFATPNPGYWGNNSAFIQPTNSSFTVSAGAGNLTNGAGQTYVAYLFAHDTDADSMIKCGVFTYSAGTTVDLGWEPQYMMVKRADASDGWYIVDSMRTWTTDSVASWTSANTAAADTVQTAVGFAPTSTGFRVPGGYGTGGQYVYMAIRRGPMRTPTDATKVFALNSRSGTSAVASTTSGFPTDTIMIPARNADSQGRTIWDRLSGGFLRMNTIAARSPDLTSIDFSASNSTLNLSSDGSGLTINQSGTQYVDYMFRRSPGFFDTVCYTGTASAQNVKHNLGVVPELMIVKRRDDTSDWNVYTSAWENGRLGYLTLNSSAGRIDGALWNMTAPTTSVFSVNGSQTNTSGALYVAYLFASCPGVSKIGSYTGNGASQTISCGFGDKGVSFVMIKKTSLGGGDWYVYDTARGILFGADAALTLNVAAAESSLYDTVDQASGGFTVNETSASLNTSGSTYMYYAIAGVTYDSNIGEILYDTPGTYEWTVPTGVTSVSAIAVGGGGATYATLTGGNSSFGAHVIANGGGIGGTNGGTGGGGSGSASGLVVLTGGAGGHGGPGNGTLEAGYNGTVYSGGNSSYAAKGGSVGSYGPTGGAGGAKATVISSAAGGGGGYWVGPGGPQEAGSGGGGGAYIGTTGNTDGGGGGGPQSGGTGGWPGGGSGGTGWNTGAGGGGGGGLAYANNIPVIPGTTVTVTVGAGRSNANYSGSGANGAVRIIWGGGRSFPANAGSI